MRLLLPITLLLTACSASDGPDDGHDTEDPSDNHQHKQAESCAQWLECVEAVDPSRLSSERAAYGEDADCWTDSDRASTCARECREALEETFLEHPLVEACDTGQRFPPEDILQTGAAWVLESTTSDSCDDYLPSRLYRADGTLTLMSGHEFRFDFDKALIWGKEGTGLYNEEGGGFARCTFDFPRFDCEGSLDGPIGEGYEWAMSMQGAFEPPYDTLLGSMQIFIEGRCWIDTTIVGFIP